MVQLLVLQGRWRHQVCRDTDCLCRRSYGRIRVFIRAFFSWRSEGLFGQSFSVTPPIQALRGLPCLGSAEEAEIKWFYEDLHDLPELTPKKDVLFIIGDWNAKVGSQEIPGVTGKFCFGLHNETD